MGTFFTWQDAYSVTSDTIDNQHKRLFEITNSLYNAFAKGEHKERIGEILDELHDYTVYHFSEEEKMMQEKGSPLPQEHLEQHKMFIAKIKDISDKHKGNRSTVTYGLMSFLRKWLTDHICQVDQMYVPVLEAARKKGEHVA